MNKEEKDVFYKAFENFNISDSDISDNVENNNDEIIVENNDINNNNLNNNIDNNDNNNNMDINKTSIFELKNNDKYNDINNTQNTYFNLGIEPKKEITKKNKVISKMCNGFSDNKFITIIDDLLYYDGFTYYRSTHQYIKKEFRNDNNIKYVCKNSRKDEKYRKGKDKFCYSQILLEVDSNNNINNQKF